jgi:hypothetical protein
MCVCVCVLISRKLSQESGEYSLPPHHGEYLAYIR